MKGPFKRAAEAKAQAEQARAQAEAAKHETTKAEQTGVRVSEVLSALFYHADQNRIVENIQKVARGH